MIDEETISDWRTNYDLHRDPHDLAEFWRPAGGVVGPVLALKAAVEEIERLRAQQFPKRKGLAEVVSDE